MKFQRELKYQHLQTEISISGMDKQKVGQVAAELRAIRPPEPYKGKGVRYKGEQITLKETKKSCLKNKVMISKIDKRKRRAKKTRAKIKELETHRLCVHRSLNHIYAQIIAPDDKTIAATSSLDLSKENLRDKIKGKIEIAKAVGQQIAKKAKSKNRQSSI